MLSKSHMCSSIKNTFMFLHFTIFTVLHVHLDCMFTKIYLPGIHRHNGADLQGGLKSKSLSRIITKSY